MMSRENGRELETELDHIRQSVQDILTTPIGTRIMRREYGSLIYQLIDSLLMKSPICSYMQRLQLHFYVGKTGSFSIQFC